MRILSFNANGLRSAASKGFFDWFGKQDVDVLCLQETKAQEHQLSDAVFRPAGYKAWFKDASTKKGYSGVAIYSRREPDEVRTSLGWPPFDDEGRYIEARFGNLSVVSFYIPSGSSGELRQGFKEEVMAWLKPIMDQWLASGREYVLCGDWNIVHTKNDIKNWKGNVKSAGFLPEERAYQDAWLAAGWTDVHRALVGEQEGPYTWWSMRGRAFDTDTGWRIDYQYASPAMAQAASSVSVVRAAAWDQRWSDHAPLVVDYTLG